MISIVVFIYYYFILKWKSGLLTYDTVPIVVYTNHLCHSLCIGRVYNKADCLDFVHSPQLVINSGLEISLPHVCLDRSDSLE